jgi:hypothetical protein
MSPSRIAAPVFRRSNLPLLVRIADRGGMKWTTTAFACTSKREETVVEIKSASLVFCLVLICQLSSFTSTAMARLSPST